MASSHRASVAVAGRHDAVWYDFSMVAIVFDLDGTLIDSRASIAAACNHALVWSGREALPESVIAGYVGDGSRNLVKRALGGGVAEKELDAIAAELLRFYEEHPTEGTSWMPNALETLDALADHPVALATNKARNVTLRILEALGVGTRFRAVVTGDDGLKPDPAPIQAALRAMGARSSDTWVVGDGVQDVLAGRAAGCKTAAVLKGFTEEDRLRSAGPDIILGSLAELVPFLQLG
jgi:phosphoglycolate phosphatase